MLQVERLVLGDYGVNCYLVAQDGVCVIIDPGWGPEAVLRVLEEKGWTPQAILLTHGHFDHVGAVLPLAQTLNIPVYLHPADLGLPSYLTRPLPVTVDLEEGTPLQVGGLSFSVLHTPGHTPGSLCYQIGDLLFSGDTLFAGSCGRTDLPGGAPRDMEASLKKLRELPGNPTLYPGHGPGSTLDRERAENPYL